MLAAHGAAQTSEEPAPTPLVLGVDAAVEQDLGEAREWLEQVAAISEHRNAHFLSFAESMEELILLNGRLVREGRLDDAVHLCEQLAEAAPSTTMFPQKFLYHAAQTETSRQRFEKAAGFLASAKALQGISLPDDWLPHAAWERAYYHIGSADLWIARGLLDLARNERTLAVTAMEEATAAFGAKKLGNVRAEIGRIELDLLLGAGHFEAVASRCEELTRELKDRGLMSGEKLEKWSDSFARRAAAALHNRSLSDTALLEDAIEAQRRLLEINGAGYGQRFESAFRLINLLRIGQRWDEANRLVEKAEGWARTDLELALVDSLRVEGQLALGAVPDDHLDEAWSAAFARLLDAWAADGARAGGSGFLAYSQRRYVLQMGMRAAMARHPEDPSHAFERYLATERIGSLARRMAARTDSTDTLTLDQIRASLVAPGEVYLVPLLSRWGGVLFVLSGTELRAETLVPLHETLEVVEQLRQLVTTVPTDDRARREEDFERFGRRLREQLLPNTTLQDVQAASLVTLVDDGAAGSLPLELVNTGNRQLGAECAIARVPSFHVESRLAREWSSADGADLALVSNVPDSSTTTPATKELGSIDLRSEEIERLTRQFGNTVTILGGPLGAEEALGSGPFASARVGEIVAHGTLDYSRERPAALVVGSRGALDKAGDTPDGLLRCDEVELSQVPDVVVLATCNSASGAERVGDTSSAHLGGAYLYAGARAVILARRELPAHATLRLLAEFNDELARGETLAEALRLARCAVAGDEALQDPYFHSQWQILGDGGLRPFGGASAATATNESTTRWIIGAAALALALFAWGLFRMRNRPGEGTLAT